MPKTKISVTVERSLVRDCDRLARGTSRSEVVERALTRWARDRRRRRLEDAIENYYASLASGERLEDAQWADLGGRALGEIWK
jgi:metal-responsive CopG/Arc/MetJ family transcriptional regulator